MQPWTPIVLTFVLRIYLAAASTVPTITDLGLNQLHDHPDASIEYLSLTSATPKWVSDTDTPASLVFVHGLDGHWRSSWTAHNGVFWPRDLIPNIFPESRIFAFAYDARTKADTPLPMDVYDHATELIGSLANEREITDVSQACLAHRNTHLLTVCRPRTDPSSSLRIAWVVS